MKLKFSIPILIVMTAVTSGCVRFPTKYPSSPPAETPSITVYGKLLDYSQNGLTVFKIQPEIVNWELNNTYLEIESKPEILYNFTYDYLRCIEQKWYPTEQECRNHFYRENNLSDWQKW